MDPREQLLASNDAVLRPLIAAGSDATRDAAMEVILWQHVRPVVQRIIGAYRATDSLSREDAEDVLANVMLRIVPRLHAAAISLDDAIASVDAYTATLTQHAIYDSFRRRFPQRTRLKQRLRYVLTRDARFALWDTPAGSVCGLRRWSGTAAHAPLDLARADATSMELDAAKPADAVAALLMRAGGAIAFEPFVQLCATLWNIVDVARDTPEYEPKESATQLASMETRESLEILWSEIRDLLPMQRAALLLNLRDADGLNAAALLLILGIATLEEIAEAAGMTAARLREVWDALPLDDLTIASLLGISRQQVINLRKSARQRLARRLHMRTSSPGNRP